MGAVIMMRAVVAGGSEDSLASIDVPINGAIVGVEWCAEVDLDADQEEASFQLSFGSTHAGVNDSRQVISNYRSALNLTTSGANMLQPFYSQLPNIPVHTGERLHLHSRCSAGVVGEIFCNVHFSFNLDQPMARRR